MPRHKAGARSYLSSKLPSVSGRPVATDVSKDSMVARPAVESTTGQLTSLISAVEPMAPIAAWAKVRTARIAAALRKSRFTFVPSFLSKMAGSLGGNKSVGDTPIFIILTSARNRKEHGYGRSMFTVHCGYKLTVYEFKPLISPPSGHFRGWAACSPHP